MSRKIKELLKDQTCSNLVGRAPELDLLLETVKDDGPLIIHLYGMAGVGKTTLLTAFAERIRREGIRVMRMDCRTIEPTVRGFLAGLEERLDAPVTSSESAAEKLGSDAGRTVLILDNYEVFRLMDTWLRREFIPGLNDRVRLVFSGRHPPLPAWLLSSAWQGLQLILRLDPLNDEEALELLVDLGVQRERAHEINRFARGHPLALRLAASASTQSLRSDAHTSQKVMGELAGLFLQDIEDARLRKALEAASVVRRLTRPILGAMLPDMPVTSLFEQLQEMDLTESRSDGLVIHEAVQNPIAATLRATDPPRFQRYRRSAWHQLRKELSLAGKNHLWRYTADIIYLLDNPVIRDAFFPVDSQEFSVEPASSSDHFAISKIVHRHEAPYAASLMMSWLKTRPKSFKVVRNDEDEVVGFYCLFSSDSIDGYPIDQDPVVQAWWHHFQRVRNSQEETAVFIRRWLSDEEGEQPCSIQAACWLDIKRIYMELRSNLRCVYLTVCNLAAYASAADKLGFEHLPELDVEIDEKKYRSALLDLGPGSVDEWISGLLAEELGLDEERLLDEATGELLLNDRRVRLTRLEFDVLKYLQKHSGTAISRSELLDEVWGHQYHGGSNVVDAVVKGLRKKLNDRADLIETVRGFGYLLRDK